jgi:heparin/heparan-sulfate lyase
MKDGILQLIKQKAYALGFLLNIMALTAYPQAYPYIVGDKYVYRLNADQARLNIKTTEIISDADTGNNKWLILKKSVPSKVDSAISQPDIIFHIKVPEAGTYQMETYAAPAENNDQSKSGANTKTSFIKIQIGDQRPTRRILYDAHEGAYQVSGKFELTGQDQQVKLWLPEGIRLGYVEWKNYNPSKVPPEVRNYNPGIVPPQSHPRLWVNKQTLPVIKARLNKEENRLAWTMVSAIALKPFDFKFDPGQEIFYREDVEEAVKVKAFYYLMTGNRKIGNEALRLMVNYLSVLEFGNIKYGDITREIGRAIYIASLVYDWCYDIAGKEDKKMLYDNMMRLAREMEIGWPPFDDSIINGHGNEAQVSRDLLAMSIAVYNEDPKPYQYTAYEILKQLVPMRKFEYQSPRHNQGVDYGAYRFGWEMHAVWLFYRMSGLQVFDDNIKDLPQYWLYMRLPNGQMLKDGDVFNVNKNGGPYYWKQPQTMLLCYAYANDPLIKGEFEREGGLPGDPVLFLLLNDPDLKAQKNLDTLPLTKDFGTILGSVIARTGWDNKPNSNDVIAEIKGGGYHFGNHQHADAGALQIYYHGMQVGDIGLYLSYGKPYDFNFNKRSVAHSMMLARDPHEKLIFRTEANDGGTRFNQRFPLTPHETISDPWFDNGTVQSADFGPSKQKPLYSYFNADLTGAYTSKISSYSRGFCFLNLEREDVPAAIILTDDMTTSKKEFKKYWQINTIKEPVHTDSGIVLHNEEDKVVGKTHVQMLIPSANEQQVDILSGEAANSTFEFKYKVNSNKPEAHAYRIMISPKTADKRNRFLTVFQMTLENTKPLPITFHETRQRYAITLADRVVCMSSGANLINEPFTVHAPASLNYHFILTGMSPGFWNVHNRTGEVNFNFKVIPGKNTLYFHGKGDEYIVTPGRSYDGVDLNKTGVYH